ncbi:MAG: DUF4416 family protein [bacterium]
MGKITQPQPVKLIVGFIAADLEILRRAEKSLVGHFGETDYASDIFYFNQTDYYEEEMGINLKRKFLSFSRLVQPEQLPEIKLYTNELEKELSDTKSRRKINIDPGYITAAKLVLATTKDYQHRLYLADGIFAEVTLRFKDGSFRSWEWTYPDYKTEQYIAVFNDIRRLYLKQSEK